MLLNHDSAALMRHGYQLPFLIGNEDLHRLIGGGGGKLDAFHQIVDPRSGLCRNENVMRISRCEGYPGIFVKQIDFIEDLYAWYCMGMNLIEHFFNSNDLGFKLLGGSIDNVQDEIRTGDLIERRFECFHQGGGKLWMKPTVSVRVMCLPSGNSKRRVVESSVANSLS